MQQDSLKGMTPPAPKEKGKDRSRGYQASKEAQNVPQRLVLCLIRDHSPSHCCQGKHSEESSINTLVAWTSMGIKQFPLASIRILIMRADGASRCSCMCGCLSPGYDPSQEARLRQPELNCTSFCSNITNIYAKLIYYLVFIFTASCIVAKFFPGNSFFSLDFLSM